MQIKLFSGMGLARLVPNPRTLTGINSASRSSTAGKAGAPMFGNRHSQTPHKTSSTLESRRDVLVSVMNLMLKSEWMFLSAQLRTYP